MKYTKELMQDAIKYYGLEGIGGVQLEKIHNQIWKAQFINVKLPHSWRRGIKAYKASKGA